MWSCDTSLIIYLDFEVDCCYFKKKENNLKLSLSNDDSTKFPRDIKEEGKN